MPSVNERIVHLYNSNKLLGNYYILSVQKSFPSWGLYSKRKQKIQYKICFIYGDYNFKKKNEGPFG